MPAPESVWDYPRPPAVRDFTGLVEIVVGGQVVVSTHDAVQILETSHPPAFYLRAADFAAGVLQPSAAGQTYCEFKGFASYWDVVVDADVRLAAAWGYREPTAGYEALIGRVTVYPGRMDGCFVDGERVVPQEGGFYGGWITSAVVGPFKGAPGTLGW